jgi:hypothetical protein
MGCQCAKNFSPEKEIIKDSKRPKDEIVAQIPPQLINKTKEKKIFHGDTAKSELSATEQSVNKVSELTSNQKPKINFPQEAFELINKIRLDPPSFAENIEKAISNITSLDGKLIYKGPVKVSIKGGEPVFTEVANLLRTMNPVPPLILSEDIFVEVPDEEEDMKNIKVFQERVEEKKQQSDIKAHFRDLIKDPYTSILLMVVDDNGKNSGKKRNVVLGKEYTKIGITHKRVRKTFCAYFTFA